MQLDSSAFVADEELVRLLGAHSESFECSSELDLFRQGDTPKGLYVLHDGEVYMTIDTDEGEPVVTMRVAPNSLLGLPGLVGNREYSMSARAKAGARLSFITREAFSKLMLTQPTMSMLVLRVLAAEVRSARLALANS